MESGCAISCRVPALCWTQYWDRAKQLSCGCGCGTLGSVCGWCEKSSVLHAQQQQVCNAFRSWMLAATGGWSSTGWRKLRRPWTPGDLSYIYWRSLTCTPGFGTSSCTSAEQLCQGTAAAAHGLRKPCFAWPIRDTSPARPPCCSTKACIWPGSVCCRAAAGWPPALMNLSAGAGGSGSSW